MKCWNLKQDLQKISVMDFIPWNELAGKKILITGATGLIGSWLINALQYVNDEKNLNLRIIALVRDLERAKEKFNHANSDVLSFVQGTVECLPKIDDSIDYIVHGASQTASKEFVQHAVETIHTSVKGTMNLLELAREKKVKGFAFLSSMEVYGYPRRGQKVRESDIGAMTPLDLRNSYPISKIMAESLCSAYAAEYQVPTRIVRLTQTFGPGVNYNDNRIFAYFARCVREKKNIVLKTRGETERAYLYTTDAVTAILSVLLKGDDGVAYNAADESTYGSIAEMAYRVAKAGGIDVEFDVQDHTQNGYPQALYMDLDTTKIKALNWMPVGYSIEEMLSRTIAGLIVPDA